MQLGAGRAGRALVGAALLAGVLTACSDDDGGEPRAKASTSAAAGDDKAAAVRSGGTIGPAGSACELPVTFDIAEDWKPEAIDALGAGDSEAVADLLRQGPVTAACEVDAKPAGHIGFLRVWTGEPGDDDARTVLEGFLADEKGNGPATYRPLEANGVPGVEAEYLYTSDLLDETKKERAFCVVTDRGPVVVGLGGLDTEEHEAMLPAYELAKRTLRVS
ncbi:lipoprotein [Streptomyces sp. enrichment culture]|uniref:lipoprotein n=1 Tax=Streptomyces sp. enrichment culture TaxID=1795815 RepID=UPI003F550F19